jgi:riboflavin-specific deaminase-like protein
MDEIRADMDLILNGAATFRAHPLPLHVKSKSLLRRRIKAGKPLQPVSAIVSSALKIPRKTKFEQAVNAERWVFCGKSAKPRTGKSLEKAGVKVFQSALARPSAKEIAKECHRQGIKKMLLEGGGELNAAFLEAGLVNRIYLTLCPILVGGAESPTFFEGKGFSEGHFVKFRLASCKQHSGELYLIFEKR